MGVKVAVHCVFFTTAHNSGAPEWKALYFSLVQNSKTESNDSTCTIDDNLVGGYLLVKTVCQPLNLNNEKIEYNAESRFNHGNNKYFDRGLWEIQWLGI